MCSLLVLGGRGGERTASDEGVDREKEGVGEVSRILTKIREKGVQASPGVSY